MLIDLAMHISYSDPAFTLVTDVKKSLIPKEVNTKIRNLFDKKQENEEQSCYGMTHYQ